MKNGIAVAGNLIVDHMKEILRYPPKQELTYVLSVEKALGGAVSNVIRDLAVMDPDLPLTAHGMVGEDSDGDYIIETLSQHKNIDLSGVRREGITSFTDVMTERDSKQRTFFTYGGANSKLSIEHFDLDAINADIFHIGYIFLLETLDEPDQEYGTKMARLLHSVQQKGIKTSVDVVSFAGAPFSKIVPPSLKYADYCIINESEAAATVGIELREGDRLIHENMPKALSALRSMGVKEWIVIHAPECSFALDEFDNYFAVPSLELPDGFIAGSVGAGDAFCAGVLLSRYKGKPMDQALTFASAAAACSLSMPGASEGLRSEKEIQEMLEKFPRKSLEFVK